MRNCSDSHHRGSQQGATEPPPETPPLSAPLPGGATWERGRLEPEGNVNERWDPAEKWARQLTAKQPAQNVNLLWAFAGHSAWIQTCLWHLEEFGDPCLQEFLCNICIWYFQPGTEISNQPWGQRCTVTFCFQLEKIQDCDLESCASHRSSGKQRKRNKDTRKLKNVSYPEEQGRGGEQESGSVSRKVGWGSWQPQDSRPGQHWDVLGMQLHSPLGPETDRSVPAPHAPAEAALLPHIYSISSYGHMALAFLCICRH